MIFSFRKRLWLLALAILGCVAIPSGLARAQDAYRKPLVDASTLKGKLIMGYQGWFNCPGDGTTVGWWHWFTGPDPTIDNLPNAADYPAAQQSVTTMLY